MTHVMKPTQCQLRWSLSIVERRQAGQSLRPPKEVSEDWALLIRRELRQHGRGHAVASPFERLGAAARGYLVGCLPSTHGPAPLPGGFPEGLVETAVKVALV